MCVCVFVSNVVGKCMGKYMVVVCWVHAQTHEGR